MLPCSVRVSTVPLPKSIRMIGTGRTVSHTASKVWLTKAATSSRENNTVLAKRAFVQQNWSSSLPIIWKSRTGLPDLAEAAEAAAKLGCQGTLPGSTFGLTKPAAGAGADISLTTRSVGLSISALLGRSISGRGAGTAAAGADRAL